MAGYRRNTQRRSSRRGRHSSSLGWVWLFLGMFIGIAGAVFAYGVYTRQWTFMNPSKGPQISASTATSKQQKSPQSPVLVQVQNKNGSTQEFEFYTLLPGMEVQLPDPPSKPPEQRVKVIEATRHNSSNHTAQTVHPAQTEQTKHANLVMNQPAQSQVSHPHQNKVEPTKETRNRAMTTTKTHTSSQPSANTENHAKIRQSPLKEKQAHKATHPAGAHTATGKPQKLALVQNTESKSNNSNTKPDRRSLNVSRNTPNTAFKDKKKMAATRYIIQTGIFRDLKEADSLKARLALKGFHSNIQKVKTQDGNHWFRVTVGPFTTEPAAISQKKRLEAQKIRSVLILQRTLE